MRRLLKALDSESRSLRRRFRNFRRRFRVPLEAPSFRRDSKSPSEIPSLRQRLRVTEPWAVPGCILRIEALHSSRLLLDVVAAQVGPSSFTELKGADSLVCCARCIIVRGRELGVPMMGFQAAQRKTVAGPHNLQRHRRPGRRTMSWRPFPRQAALLLPAVLVRAALVWLRLITSQLESDDSS